MDTEGLRLFVLAAERLNISAAGRELGMGPAVSSARLAKLEKALNTQLFHRSTRKVSLSSDGEEYLPFAKEIMALEDAGLDALGSGIPEPKGTIRFAASSTFAQLHIAPILPEFLSLYPMIKFDLKLSDKTFDLIEGSFDLALRSQALPDSGFRSRKLRAEKRVLCASHDYLQEMGAPVSPHDLARHRLIGFQTGEPRKLVHQNGNTALFEPDASNSQVTVDDGLSQKILTMAGAGISANADLLESLPTRTGVLTRNSKVVG